MRSNKTYLNFLFSILYVHNMHCTTSCRLSLTQLLLANSKKSSIHCQNLSAFVTFSKFEITVVFPQRGHRSAIHATILKDSFNCNSFLRIA